MSVRDIREDMTRYVMRQDTVVASFDLGGRYKVSFKTHFGETRIVHGLDKIEACKSVSSLRKRGYVANMQGESYI